MNQVHDICWVLANSHTPPAIVTDTGIIVAATMARTYCVTAETCVTAITQATVIWLFGAVKTRILARRTHPLRRTVTERLDTGTVA